MRTGVLSDRVDAGSARDGPASGTNLIGIPLCSEGRGCSGNLMNSNDWTRRVRLFVQRFWQPTSACMTCMPGSWSQVANAVHWATAIQTGLATGILAVLLSFTPVDRLYKNRYGNALIVGGLTAIGDAYSHANHYDIPYGEALVTGLVSGLLALVGSFLFEDRARRIRAVWTRLSS